MVIYYYIVILIFLLLFYFEIFRCLVGDVMIKIFINGYLFLILILLLFKRLIIYFKVDYFSN